MKALVDNDIILKGACYGLLPELLSGVSDAGDPVGVLGAARFAVSKRIRRAGVNKGADAAQTNLQDFLNRAVTIEPTGAEQSMAGDFELAAMRSGVSLDAGESQLCAVLIERVVPFLLTGDKRAIRALEQLLDSEERLGGLRGKVKCLEQLVLDAMAGKVAAKTLRLGICAEAHIDKTLSICFACSTSPDTTEDSDTYRAGLISYITDLRKQATRILGN